MVRDVREQGFTLIEVLIAVLVLAIGLLGLAGLQASALRFNHDAELRSQATALAYDISDRMRANSTAARKGDYYIGVSSGSCGDEGGASVAAQDLSRWLGVVSCLLPQGRGAVTAGANDTVMVTVRWNERTTADPDFDQEFRFATRIW